MRHIFKTALIAFCMTALPSVALAEDPSGQWMRPNGDVATVSLSGGKLWCKITSGSKPGFEMCHGMAASGGGWAGNKMKHPSMPGMMTFNGSVKVSGNTFKIKGCAIGQSMCDEESWSRM